MTDQSHLPKYRRDIDGLRAIAVIAVVIFHAFPKIKWGGFIGVDIFFVISGYLITSIVISSLNANSFTLKDFYSRRIRRIFPALIIVLVFSFITGWFGLLGDEFRQYCKHMVAGAGFVSNLLLWRESGYFDATSDTKILLHLWSLGIEEQFYLFWPILILISWRRLNIVTLSLLIICASFLYCVWVTGHNTSAAFYSPLSRIWELMIGSLLALLMHSRSKYLKFTEIRIQKILNCVVFSPGHGDRSSFKDIVSITGASLLVLSFISISPSTPFPGWRAMGPVLGTFLLIYAGSTALVNRAFLSNKLLVGVGKISYPLYLWHWPLLALAHTLEVNPVSNSARLGIVALSVLLSVLTFYVIEKPIRSGNWGQAKVFILGATMVGVAVVGAFGFTYKGPSLRPIDKELEDYSQFFNAYFTTNNAQNAHAMDELSVLSQNNCNFYDIEGASLMPRKSIDPACYTKTKGASVLVWGNSFGADLFYGLKETLPKDVSPLLVFASGCSIAFPNAPGAKQAPYCEKMNEFALETAKNVKPEIVILSPANSANIAHIRLISQTLKDQGVRKIFVIGGRPEWNPYLYKVIAKDYWKSSPKYIKGYQDEGVVAADQAFRSALKKSEPFEYIDLHDFFCNDDGCMTYLGNDRREGLYTFDRGHFRPFFSLHLFRNKLTTIINSQIEMNPKSR